MKKGALVDGVLPTLGLDLETFNGYDTMFTFWDFAGLRKHLVSNMNSILSNIDALIVAYDITERSTFENVVHWMTIASSNIPSLVYLIGTKSDLSDERLISQEEGRKFAVAHNMRWAELTCIDASNISVNEFIEELCELLKRSDPPSILQEIVEAKHSPRHWYSSSTS